jgi:hypothetical protein
MGQLGMGVMIHRLFGGSGGLTPEQYDGLLQREIKGVALEDNAVKILLDGAGTLVLTDEGQSCCENRYITTDDDLPYFVGSRLMDVELGEHRSTDSEYGNEHEIQFLNVKTSKGVITFETHNEHNGYYGGFAITAKLQQ